MANASCKQYPFKIITIGKTSNQVKSKHHFPTYENFQNHINIETNFIIIAIVSNDIEFDLTSLNDVQCIGAVYNEELLCFYCKPELVQPVDIFLKKQTKGQSCSHLSTIGTLIRKYWFLIGLLLSILLAYLFPNVGKKGGYIRSEWTIKWGAVIIIFFLSGLSLRTRQLGQELLNIRLHALVQVCSFLLIPLFMYGLSLLLTMTPFNKMLIFGMLVMSSTSTTISSNVVMTKNARGNEYAALLNAVLGNFIGIFLSPLLIFYFMKSNTFSFLSGKNQEIYRFDYIHVIKNLSLSVLLPLFAGQIIHLIWTKHVIRIRERLYFAELNSIALLTLVWSVFCTAFDSGSFETINKWELCILIAIETIIYGLLSMMIMIIARLPIPYWQFSEKDTVAIIFCGATKTLAMGIPLINALFENKSHDITGLVSIPLIIYHAVQLIFGSFEVIILKSWIGKSEKRAAMVKNAADEADQCQTIHVQS